MGLSISYLIDEHWAVCTITLMIISFVGSNLISYAYNIKNKICRCIAYIVGWAMLITPVLIFINHFKSSILLALKFVTIGICGIIVVVVLIIIIQYIWGSLSHAIGSKMHNEPEIVVICGNMELKSKIYSAGQKLKDYGYNVIYPLQDYKSDDRSQTDIMHDYIRAANIVYVVGENQRIDDTVKDEVEYAIKLNKKILYDIGGN